MGQVPKEIGDIEETIRLVLHKLVLETIESKYNWAGYIFEKDQNDFEVPEHEELSKMLANSSDLEAEVQDALMEINLGTKEEKRITYMSTNLKEDNQVRMVKLLKEYKDCFAWNCVELPGLFRQ